LEANQYPGLEPRAVDIVRRRARKLIGRYGIYACDVADLEQSWLTKLLSCQEYAEPEHLDYERRIARLVRLFSIDEIRRRTAGKRGGGVRSVSLDDYIEGPGGSRTPLRETVSEADYFHLTGQEHIGLSDSAAARLDLETFLAILPPDLRVIAEALKLAGPEELASRTRLSRATAYRRLNALRELAREFFFKSR
jgi:hypothetical protein